MAKEAYYFPHEYDTRSDDKMAPFMMEHGAIGYGIYWIIVEMLHKSEDSRIESKASTIKRIAATSKVGLEDFETILKSCLEYELLIEKDGFIYIERVLRNKRHRQDMRLKKSEAGKKGAEARWQNMADDGTGMAPAIKNMASAINYMASANGNMANDGKGKESKGKEESIDIGGEPPPQKDILEKNKALLAKRQSDFYNSLVSFVDLYGKDMIRAFYDHWSEPNKSHSKMAMDYERTWDLQKRLDKWQTNDKRWNKGKGSGTATPPVLNDANFNFQGQK